MASRVDILIKKPTSDRIFIVLSVQVNVVVVNDKLLILINRSYLTVFRLIRYCQKLSPVGQFNDCSQCKGFSIERYNPAWLHRRPLSLLCHIKQMNDGLRHKEVLKGTAKKLL